MTSIFVAKLDFGVTNEQLKELFAQYGKVLKASVATDRETGKSRGFGFVEMANEGEAQNAIRSLDGHKINGRPITVKQAEARENRSPAGNNNPRRDNDFKPRNNDNRKENNSPKREGFTPPPPIVEIPLIDPRKKVVKEKDKKTLEDENRNKKPKLNPYKKSGKNNKFFDDDDFFDEDDDLLNYKRKDDDDFLDDDEDDDEEI